MINGSEIDKLEIEKGLIMYGFLAEKDEPELLDAFLNKLSNMVMETYTFIDTKMVTEYEVRERKTSIGTAVERELKKANQEWFRNKREYNPTFSEPITHVHDGSNLDFISKCTKTTTPILNYNHSKLLSDALLVPSLANDQELLISLINDLDLNHWIGKNINSPLLFDLFHIYFKFICEQKGIELEDYSEDSFMKIFETEPARLGYGIRNLVMMHNELTKYNMIFIHYPPKER